MNYMLAMGVTRNMVHCCEGQGIYERIIQELDADGSSRTSAWCSRMSELGKCIHILVPFPTCKVVFLQVDNIETKVWV